MEHINLFELGNYGADKFKRVKLNVENGVLYIHEGELVWKGGGYDSIEKKTPITFSSLKDYAKIISDNLFKLYKNVNDENWKNTIPHLDEDKIVLFEFKYHDSDKEKSYFCIDRRMGTILLSKMGAIYLQYVDYERFKLIGERFSSEQIKKYKDMNETNWKEYI